MNDPDYDPSAETTYECLNCGTTVKTDTPSGCPDCGGSLRNTALPLE